MENYKAGGEKGNSNLFATNRLFKQSPLFRKRKKKAPGIYNPKAKYIFDEGGALLTKKVTCKKCGWEWDAADGGNDITTCHKCGGQGLVHAQKGGGLNEYKGGGPIDCGEGYEWNEELQECVEYTSKYNQQSLAKHLAEKKIYEDALKEIEAGTAEYAILEEAYNAKVKKLEKEKARVLKVRGNVIPASQNLDVADSKINTQDPLYQNFLNASNPKELELARKALPQEIKNLLPNQGSYNVAKWNSKTNNWKDGSHPGRELYCTPYGCFAYQKAGASDVPIIGGNIDFANRASTGNFAFEKINPNERQLGDIALMVENAPNDYTDRNSGVSRRPHHTTIYAGPDTNAPKDSEKGYFYNADDGVRLNFKKSYLATDETPGDRFDYYRYVGAQNKINDEILNLAKQKEEFNIKQEQRKNNVALPSMATLEPKLITQNNTATLQYSKKEEILKPKNKKLFKKKSFKYGGLNKFEEEGMILDLSPEKIKQYIEGGYVIEDISVPSLSHMDNGGELCEQGFERDPITGECIVLPERTQDVQEVRTNQYSPYVAAYEQANPRDAYVYQKKADYLNKYKGLNRQAGLSQDNFNTDVEGNFNKNWEYDKNSEVIKQFAKDNNINPKNHVELVEKMADKGNVSREMIANSKYGSKLQPSLWARSLAGAQELGNAIVKLLPGEQGDVFNKQTAGLTKKEWDEIHNSSTGALETLAVGDLPGAVIANSLADLSTASGGNFQESPGLLSGELKSNVDPTKAALLNPFLYAGIGQGLASAPKIAEGAADLYKGAKNLYKGASNYGNDIIQTSKQAGKFELPKYSSAYRVEHAGFNTPSSADDLTGRWFARNPKDVQFYADKLKDPKTGEIIPLGQESPVRIMRKRLPEYKIKEQFGAGMPEEARTMSMGRGDFTNAGLDDLLGPGAGDRFTQGKFINSDYNAMESAPFLFRQEEGILDANRVNQLRSGTNQGRFSSGNTTILDNQVDAINHLKNEQKLINNQSRIKKFLPFKEGGYIIEELDTYDDSENMEKNMSKLEIKKLIAKGYVIEEI